MADEEFKLEPVSFDKFYNALVADTKGINLATEEGKNLLLKVVSSKIVTAHNDLVVFKISL